MRPATSPSTGKPSGRARVCRVWKIARSTVSWHRRAPAEPGARRGPVGPCPDDEWVAPIRPILEASSFPGEGDRKVWARLRYQGIRPSPRRVLRLLRAHGVLAPTRHGPPHGAHAHEGTISTERVEVMWGTAMPTTCTRPAGQGALCIAVDHGAAEGVGIHAAKQGTRCAAWEPLRPGGCAHCGAFAPDGAQGVRLRHDQGSQERSHVFQEERAFVGIASAPALVREPAGTGCAER